MTNRSRGAAAALDLEMLGRLQSHGRPVTIPGLFGGITPTWAANAAERLHAAGFIDRDRDGRYALNDAGRERLAKYPTPPGGK